MRSPYCVAAAAAACSISDQCVWDAVTLLRGCCAVASDIRKRIALKWSARRVRPRVCCAPQLGSNYQADNQADTSADTSVRTKNYQADNQADTLADNQADTPTISSELIIGLIIKLIVL